MRGKTATLAATALLISLVASAGDQPCSIHAKKGQSKDELTAMAKWSQADALAAALKSLNVTADKATVKKSELEVEGGCLSTGSTSWWPGRLRASTRSMWTPATDGSSRRTTIGAKPPENIRSTLRTCAPAERRRSCVRRVRPDSEPHRAGRDPWL